MAPLASVLAVFALVAAPIFAAPVDGLTIPGTSSFVPTAKKVCTDKYTTDFADITTLPTGDYKGLEYKGLALSSGKLVAANGTEASITREFDGSKVRNFNLKQFTFEGDSVAVAATKSNGKTATTTCSAAPTCSLGDDFEEITTITIKGATSISALNIITHYCA